MDKRDRVRTRTSEDVMRRLGKNVEVLVDEVDGLTVQVKKKVGEDEIISKINQSAEAITLDANKININGVISANGNFSVDTQGNMTCNSADINNAMINNATINTINGTTNDASLEFSTNYGYGGEMYSALYCGIMELNNYADADPDTGEGLESIEPQIRLWWDFLGTGTTIGASYIDTDGDVYCNSVIPSSLEEKKKDFEKFENALEIVKDTDIYKYHFKNQKETDKKHIGFVIGENYKYRQELTDLDNKGVDLYSMISVLWRAVQEQQVEIEKLKKEVKNDKS